MSVDQYTDELTSQISYALQSNSGEPLSNANFDRLASFIYNYCGIRITEKKRTMIDGRLRRRMRALDIDDINAYCQFLFDSGEGAAEAEVVHFIDAVTTNKTDFFRENSHFDYLQSDILPRLEAERRGAVRIWSAACSNGAEPYTLAMVLEDYCAARLGLDYAITASDICTAVLTKARDGRFPMSMIDPIPEDARRRHIMLPRDPRGREFRIKPNLRSKVSFCQLNLIDDHYSLDRNFDVIFCRNVLIYFDRPTQERVLSHLCNHLRHGGYLVLGHSESVTGLKLPLHSVANTIFKRG